MRSFRTRRMSAESVRLGARHDERFDPSLREGVIHMANQRSYCDGSHHGNSSFREVSDARLHQHSGLEHAFGGWEKVNNGDGSFWMRETD